MVKKNTKKVETKVEDKLVISFNDEEWKGNNETVVSVSQGNKEIIKFSLNSFTSSYGKFMLNKEE